jgi:cation diffusion facilitator family transporter
MGAGFLATMVTRQAAIETSRAATLSIVSNSLLTALKLAAGFMTGSVSVLAEGIHSGNDLLASLLAWFAIRKANEPEDEEHHYGHGKYESLSAALEAGLIVVAALGVMCVASRRILQGNPGDLQHGPALVAMGFSAVTNVLVSTYLFKVARRHDSVALAADAWHLRADVWTSVGVFLSLGLILLTDWHFLDPLAAVLVGFLILFQGGRIGREALHQLLDRSLPPDEMEFIRVLLAEHDEMFMEYHKLRARKAGRERQIDLHLVTCPRVTVEAAHGVTEHLEEAVRGHWPATRMIIHIEPCREAECLNRGSDARDPEACVLRRRTESFLEK